MANWKFTDQYGKTYPALANSILNILVFDVAEGSSPVDGTSFSAPLNLSATGKTMKVLDAITGLSSIPMSGTVTTDDNTLTVKLSSTDDDDITAAVAKLIPLIGGDITQKAWISIDNTTPASATADDDPTTDEFDLNVTIAIGSGTGTLTTQIPMSIGLFTLKAEFENFGVQLSDLNFLAGGSDFSTFFPDTLPSSYYTPNTTTLNLLSMDLALNVSISPKVSVSVATASVSIGIVNIPLKPNALFLSPLAIWINLTNPTSSPTVTWGLDGSVNLYPYGKQSDPPASPPDFTFEFQMEMPTKQNPTFVVSGNFDNPDDQPVSTIISDLLDDGTFNTGIASTITLEKFDFNTAADTSSGTISEFSVDIAMSSTFGLFQTQSLDIKDFSISVSYES
ncbi:MAG: hypothetical protein R2824_25590 [Saprospiraceae bacterium]|nr:hypothetical protein [Lewinella sp.]